MVREFELLRLRSTTKDRAVLLVLSSGGRNGKVSVTAGQKLALFNAFPALRCVSPRLTMLLFLAHCDQFVIFLVLTPTSCVFLPR